MFTPARIFFAIDGTVKALMATALFMGSAPIWAKVALVAVGAFAGLMVGTNGPIQESAAKGAKVVN